VRSDKHKFVRLLFFVAVVSGLDVDMFQRSDTEVALLPRFVSVPGSMRDSAYLKIGLETIHGGWRFLDRCRPLPSS
jgi:hypothetical protein